MNTPLRSFVPMVLGAAVLGALTLVATHFLGRAPVVLELGACEGGVTGRGWSGGQRATLDPQATTDDVVSFYFRAARPNSTLHLPLGASGPLRLSFRARATVRSAIAVFVSGQRAGEILVGTGPWTAYTLEIPPGLSRPPLEVALAFRPLPLVAGEHAARPEMLVDAITLQAPEGLTLSWAAGSWLALVPMAMVVFCRLLGHTLRTALFAGLGAAVVTTVLVQAALFPWLAAAPRLLPFALAAGLLTHRIVGSVPLAWLVAAGVAFHGSVAFFPNHNPPDLETHITRTLDFRSVPLQRDALLRYGSHLPTASQQTAPGTDLFGSRTLIPYSPLSYLVYYGAHRLGLDLHWAITVINTTLLMAVVPLCFVTASRLWTPTAGWLAALFFTLDLPIWHHVGRAHAPASFGAALTTAALLLLAWRADALDSARRLVLAAVLLAAAALGYSSALVALGLFGVVLLALLAADARALAAHHRRRLALALVGGGLLAGGLFYFHYLPGVVRGASGVEAEPDLIPGSTFFIFHNEARQVLRIWRLGFWMVMLAGLCALPFALRRVRKTALPVLVSWLAAWALVMVLKEPGLFPRLLRWAKEDQFVSPLVGLVVAGALSAIPEGRSRWWAFALVLAIALWLQLRDFSYHAHSLLL